MVNSERLAGEYTAVSFVLELASKLILKPVRSHFSLSNNPNSRFLRAVCEL
jgi:hypothetical protein